MKALVAELRHKTRNHAARTIIIGAGIFAVYLSALVVIIALESVLLKAAFCALLSFIIGQLVVVGHDAAHNALSSNKMLNRWFGLVMFLPALHPYSLWIHHHNFVHHRFVAQIGKDNAFPPLTPDQYRALPAWKRLRYRFYRSLIGQHFWYFFDVQVPRILFPFFDKTHTLTKRNIRDAMILYCWVIALAAACVTVSMAAHPGKPAVYHFLNAVVFGVFLPAFFWSMHLNFLSIFQHTGPGVKWRLADGKPSSYADMMAGTVHVVFPEWLDIVFMRIMQHQAHHLNVHIDLHALKSAQETVADANGRRLVRPWTWRYHLEVTRQCKLYDPDKDDWVTFKEIEGARPARACQARERRCI